MKRTLAVLSVLLALVAGARAGIERIESPTTNTPSMTAAGCIQTGASGSVFKANCGDSQVTMGVATTVVGSMTVTANSLLNGSSIFKNANKSITLHPNYTAADTNHTFLADTGMSFAFRTDSGGPFWIGSNGAVATWSPMTVVGSMTVTGSMKVNGSTFTVAESGIISAPSQPFVKLTLTGAQALNNGVAMPIYWGAETFSRGSMHSTTVSSQTVTVPTGGAGIYVLACALDFAANATGGRQIIIYHNGNYTQAGCKSVVNSGTYETRMQCTTYVSASAGDTFYCEGSQDSGGDLNVGTFASYFVVGKIW